MSDSNLPVPERYTRFDFAGGELIAVFRSEEGMAIPVRLVCERLGLDLNGQSRRLRKHPVLRQGLRKDRVPLGDRMQEIMVILHKYIPFWLATIDPNAVDEEYRGALILYQTELVDVLAALYLRQSGQAVTPERRQIIQLAEDIRLLLAAQRDQEKRLDAAEERLTVVEGVVDDLRQFIPVTPAQAEFLLRSLKRLGAHYEQRHKRKIYDMLFARFKADLGIQRYDALPSAAYEQALQWIENRAREYLPDDDDALPPRQERLL
jgi:P22_AR N-terminal domain/ORF6C domain